MMKTFLGAILDDVSLAASPRLARTFADAFVQANKELGSGLEVNTTKTEVYPATEEAAKYFGATSNDAEARGNAWQDVKMVPAQCRVSA